MIYCVTVQRSVQDLKTNYILHSNCLSNQTVSPFKISLSQLQKSCTLWHCWCQMIEPTDRSQTSLGLNLYCSPACASWMRSCDCPSSGETAGGAEFKENSLQPAALSPWTRCWRRSGSDMWDRGVTCRKKMVEDAARGGAACLMCVAAEDLLV